MVKGKTKSGFEFSIDESTVNSMEFYDVLADLKDAADIEEENPNDPNASLGVVQAKRKYEILILGKAQRDALIEHCRGENGCADAKVFQAELAEIMSAAKGPLKNS